MIKDIDKIEDDEDLEDNECPHCGGTGEIEIMDKQEGDNIIPGGFWEGSGEFRPCKACEGTGIA